MRYSNHARDRELWDLEPAGIDVPDEAVAMADDAGNFIPHGYSPDPAANRAEYARFQRWWQLKREWCRATGRSSEAWRIAIVRAKRT